MVPKKILDHGLEATHAQRVVHVTPSDPGNLEELCWMI